MKDKFQSLVGMRGACGWLNDPLITHLSPTNHPLKHGVGKYIFSFLLVLAMSIGQMWAQLTPALPATTLTLPNIPTEGWKGTVTPNYYKAAGSNVYVFNPYELYLSVANLTWTTQNSGGNTSATPAAMAPFPASSVFTGYKAATLNNTSKGPYAYRVTNCVAAYVYCKSGSDKKRTITLAAYEVDGEGNVAASAAESSTYETNSDGVISITLNKDKEYYIKVSQVGSGSSGSSSGNSPFYMIAFQAPYKVTLDPDGGSYPSNTLAGWTYDNVNDKYSKYVAAGSLTLPSAPSKGGYDFTEWQDNKANAYTTSITIDKDTVLTAQWIAAGSAYDVNIASMTNGSVVASPTSQVEDGIVTLTVTPDDGYLLSSLSVVGDVSGDEVTVTANQFTMPAEDVTINATFSLAPTYTVTLNPAGGTIVDATGWTLNAGNYEKEVAEGTVLTLPTFTKTDRAFKTWRKAGPADVASPVTVDGDLSLTAIWTATIEQVIYSWEGAEGGAIETGGTASSSTNGGSSFDDAQINVKQAETELYCLQINGNNSFGTNLVQITLAGEEKVKTGDKIKYWGFYSKSSNANARPKMRDANGSNASIFDDPNNLPNLYNGGDPAERTFTVPAGINTSAVQITRSQTGSNTWISKLQIIREVQVEEGDLLTVTFDANGGSAIAPVVIASGQAVAKPTDPTWAHHRFNEWQLAGSAYDFSSAVTTDITLVANWTQLYTISFAAVDGSGDAPAAIADKAQSETFEVPANTFTPPTGQVFDHWNDGTNDYNQGDTYTVGTNNVTLTAVWRTPSTMYAITKGAHENGDFTIDPASQEAGEVVTLEATPDDGYLFGAWEVVKTEDASATGITVDANGQFTMPGYAVTVNATFVVDPRKKILYVTGTAEETVKANDKLYAALKDDYHVTIVGPTSDADQTSYDLVVLHESVGGGNYGAAAVATAKAGDVPVLNTKSYFYNSDRWNWGTPNAGQSVKGATQNSAYCNIADHPLFDGVTMTAGFFEITDDAAAKCMQPVGSFTSGKEGYTLATTPNNGEGNGCAIHELTPAQRGASAGKYLMISVSGDKLNALNANGQKLFQNAAAYLIGSASWEPISVPTAAEVTATPSENYTEGNTITLTASATGTSASTTYSWYKGADWATASATTPVQAAATAATDGNVFTKTAALGDEGTYWCNISNGTSCDVQASVTITVSSASTPTHAITYDNTKGADMTAYPTEYTEGIGVASFDDLADITGWHFVEWSPASIAADATTDQTITAVWAQVFEVTFDLQGHGASIDAQDIVSGGKVTKPNDPVAIGWDFGGWFTDAECTAGNEFDFETPIAAATPLFAKWTEFGGCVELWPATSGSAPAAVGDAIVMQTGSKGAAMTVAAKPERLTYTAYGLQFGNESGVKVNVVLNNDMTVGTKISLTLVATALGARGLHLYNADGSAKITSLGWADATVHAEETFTYTVVADDGLDGTNAFQLWRNNTVILKTLKVESCGAAVIYHGLTSAITPDHDPAYATVTLGASSVREGRTTTATYSDINAAYEFDEWQISGTGATLSSTTANPVTITMGTADAVVTLKLKVATPKHTVTFNKMGTGADVPSQLVKEGDLVPEPSVVEPEGWILEGWYKESTLETKWDFASDVMGTSDMELFAKWVVDNSIKLIKSDGSINHENFTTGVTATTVTYSETDHNGAAWGGTQGAISGTNTLGKIVQYNATTDQMKIKIFAYSTNSGAKEIYIHRILEGEDTEQVIETLAVASKTPVESEYYTFNNTKNRSFYLTTNSTDVKILQVKVVDDGTPIKHAGQVGYTINLNKGRVVAYSNTEIDFEGMTLTTSSNYGVISSTELQTKSNVAFTVASPVTISVTTNAAKYYVSQNASEDGTTATAVTAAGTASFDLTAGTWYIVPSTTSAVKLTNIAFTAPKCAEPAFNSLANSDICSGDPYVALNGTATVADAGIPTYQWYREDNSAIDGETNATYTPDADGKYYVIAVNHLAGFSDNEKKSDLVTVTTHAGTAITEGLVDLRGAVDDVVTLEVVASGKNLHYAWKESATIDGTYTDVAGAADAASLDVTITAGMDKYYKVVVTSACGDAQESIAKVEQFVPVAQADVTGSIAWNWANAASVAEIKLTDSTTPKKNEGFVMANGAATVYNNANFESDKLYLEGEYIVRDGKYFQGQTIKFNTTVAGAVRVKFSHTGNSKPARELYINGVGTGDSRTSATAAWSRYVEVPAGEVTITAYHVDPADGAGQQYIRVPEIEFLALDKVRDDEWLAPNELGTICYPNGHVAVGAEIYKMSGVDENNKFVFDEVEVTEPGVPYLFVSQVTYPETIKFYKTTAAAAAVAGTSNGMVGTFSNIVLDYTDSQAAKWYYFSGMKFYSVARNGGDVSIPANRAYVDMNEPHPASAPMPGRKRMTFGVVGAPAVTTAVENAEATTAPRKMMINGKLFILRGEKMFDATGRLIK